MRMAFCCHQPVIVRSGELADWVHGNNRKAQSRQAWCAVTFATSAGTAAQTSSLPWEWNRSYELNDSCRGDTLREAGTESEVTFHHAGLESVLVRSIRRSWW
jgi:hypothetical protein